MHWFLLWLTMACARPAPTPVVPPPDEPWKACPEGQVFDCRNLRQGVALAPEQRHPTVCGCMPTSCPDGQGVVTSAGMGTWPDGTQKGAGHCSSLSEPPP